MPRGSQKWGEKTGSIQMLSHSICKLLITPIATGQSLGLWEHKAKSDGLCGPVPLTACSGPRSSVRQGGVGVGSRRRDLVKGGEPFPGCPWEEIASPEAWEFEYHVLSCSVKWCHSAPCLGGILAGKDWGLPTWQAGR